MSGDIMGRLNQVVGFMGQVQGAMDTVAPALGALNYGMTNMGQVLNGYAPSAYYPTYPQGGYVPASPTPTTFGDDNIALGMVGAAAGGGLIGGLAARAANLAKSGSSGAATGTAEAAGTSALKTGMVAGLKGLGAAALRGTGIGAAVGAVTSLVGGLIRGERGGELVGSVTADTIGGAGSGLAAAAVGGLAVAGLAAVGVAGLPLTLAGIGAGIAGGMAADYGFRATGLRQWISDKVHGMIG